MRLGLGIWRIAVSFRSARRGSSDTPSHNRRFLAAGQFKRGVLDDQSQSCLSRLLDRGQRCGQEVPGQMFSRVRGTACKIRHDAMARRGGTVLNIVGDRGQQCAEAIAAFAGILVLALDPRSRTIGFGNTQRRVGVVGGS